MPTEKSTRSRSALVTREYATYGGKKPVLSKTLDQVAPKAVSSTAAAPAPSTSASQEWMPTTVGRDALKAVGRAALPKAVLRVAGSIARTAAPSVLRTVYTGDDLSVLALAIALGAGEATHERRSVLVVSEQSEAVKDKFAALYPAQASACVVAADKAAVTTTKKCGLILCDAATACAVGSKASAAFDISVVVFNGADAEATSRLRLASGSLAARRSVIVGASVKAVTSVGLRGGKADPEPAQPVAGAAPTEAPPLRSSVEMNYFVTQGIAKFNLLHTLVRASGATKKILVRFATKEVASLYCDVLLALDVKAAILCDVQDDASLDQDGGGGSDPQQGSSPNGLPNAGFLRSTLRDFEGASAGCVLLSAFGLSSPKADVILEFDPPADLRTFVASTLNASGDDARAETHIMMLEPSANVAAIAAMKHHATALATVANQVATVETPSKKKSRSEAEEATPGQKLGQWRFKKLPTPSAATSYITGNKLRSLGKKLFTINNKGFKAYRSFVHYYALLQPKSIFDVYKLSLEEVAAQFGLDEAPLLDLRTKVTQFRPKEDYSKFAQQREKRERREFREYAAANLLPEEPEEEPAQEPAAEEAA